MEGQTGNLTTEILAVNRMRELRKPGVSFGNIASKLNTEGFLTVKGQPFGAKAVSVALLKAGFRTQAKRKRRTAAQILAANGGAKRVIAAAAPKTLTPKEHLIGVPELRAILDLKQDLEVKKRLLLKVLS